MKIKKSVLRQMIKEEIQKLNEATIELDTVDSKDKHLLKYLKKNKIKIIKNTGPGPAGGADEVTYKGTRESLRKMTIDMFGDEWLSKFIKGK